MLPNTEVDDLRRENTALRLRNQELLRRGGADDAVVRELATGGVTEPNKGATPVLLEAAQDGWHRSEQLMHAIFDGAVDAMVLADDTGRCVDANPAACALFELSLERLIGGGVDDPRTPAYRHPPTDPTAAERAARSGQFPLRRADGRTHTVDYRVANVAPGIHLSVLRDVTDRIDAEESTRQSAARFRAVLEKSTEAISLTAADGTTQYITPAAARVLGWTAEEMIGRTMRDQVVAEDRPRIAEALERLVREGGRDLAMEFRVRHRDGSILWIESSATNLLDDPDVRAIVGNYRDITARKHSEAAVRECCDLLEEAQAIAHVGSTTFGFGAEEGFSWSRECRRIFGIPDGVEITQELALAAAHPEDRDRVRIGTRRLFEQGVPFDLEYRVQRPDGSVRWVHGRAVVERDASGRAIRVIGSVQDITDRHAAVAALRASEERYRRIVENTAEGVWMYDAADVTTFMNARMAEMLGCTVSEGVGQSIYAFIDVADHEAARARTARRRRGISERGDFKLRRKDGTPLWVTIQANRVFDADGGFESLALVGDISEQRRADVAHARLAALVESSADAISSTSLDGTITSWNLGAEKLYQYSAEDMVGKSISQLSSPAMLDRERRIIESAARGEGVQQHETQHLRKDGSVVDVALTISPIRDGAGQIIGVAKIARDLTARREAEATLARTEEQFRQVQKMEAVGRLAGGVAHDFNNLLSVVLSYASLAASELKPGDPLRDDLEEIRKAGQRATELTRQLLVFSRQQILQPRVVDLEQVVGGMTSMLGRLLGENIELTVLPSPAEGRVLADPGQIEQVLMNLAVNARDAMPDGGRLTIETENVEIGEEYVGSHLGATPGHYVLLAVSDTGIGMDPATCSRIFEPFFTTKPVGRGTGLGLSTVFGIVEQTGGHVRVYSELGHGTTFKVYLPRTDRVPDAEAAPDTVVVLHGTETILLVEDDEQVRAVAAVILRRHGYHVLDASNGGEAFLIAKDFGSPIDLLLTDVVLPRMSGRKLAEHLAPERPAMKVLFASGYTDDAMIHHGVLGAGMNFLQKPFTPDALLHKVRAVLDAGA